MSAIELIHAAQAVGVTVTASREGKILLAGKREAVRTVAPWVKDHKDELLSYLTRPRRLWLIRHQDGTLCCHSITPPASPPEVLTWYPDALSIEPEAICEPPAHPA